jgi:hypothetical protein
MTDTPTNDPQPNDTPDTPEEVEQTDNRPKPEDGEQDVSQDQTPTEGSV